MTDEQLNAETALGQRVPLNDELADDCPFSYAVSDIEPPEPKHKIKGICVFCGGGAYTQNPKNLGKFVCWGCAYSLAN